MKTLSVPPIDAQIESRIAQMLKSSSDVEAVIFAMKDSGLDKIESIKLLRAYGGMSLADGKTAVHLSKAWEDCRESDDALHEQVIRAAEALGFTEELH
jgi:ribosomal protein L7/L12